MLVRRYSIEIIHATPGSDQIEEFKRCTQIYSISETVPLAAEE